MKELTEEERKNRITVDDKRDGYGEAYDFCDKCHADFWKRMDIFLMEEGEA